MTDSEPKVEDVASKSSRRGFMFKIGAGLVGIGGLLIAAPVLGYIFAPAFTNWEKQNK